MPRTQTTHLSKDRLDGTTWCDEYAVPTVHIMDEATCGECLQAVAEYGRLALVRGFELGLFEVRGAP